MTAKENARPGVAAPGQAVESGSVYETARPSVSNDTTGSAGRQPFRVSDLLHPGAANAASRRDLMSLTGLRDRELRLLIVERAVIS